MTTSIPAIIARLGWDRIGLLKVDFPGAEADLLSDPGDWINLVDVLASNLTLASAMSNSRNWPPALDVFRPVSVAQYGC